MVRWPATAQRAAQQQRQLLPDPGLPDEVVEPLGPQGALDGPLVPVRQRRDDAVTRFTFALPPGRPPSRRGSAVPSPGKLRLLGPGQCLVAHAAETLRPLMSC